MELDKMREDYRVCLQHWREVEGWTPDDLNEVRTGVRVAMEGTDAKQQEGWAKFLADKAEVIRREKAMRGKRWP